MIESISRSSTVDQLFPPPVIASTTRHTTRTVLSPSSISTYCRPVKCATSTRDLLTTIRRRTILISYLWVLLNVFTVCQGISLEKTGVGMTIIVVMIAPRLKTVKFLKTLTHRPRFQGPYFTLFTIRMTLALPLFR